MPEKVWDMLFDMTDLVVNAKPNPAHKALATLEEMGYLKAIITQNVDNLHPEAGNKNVIEYHGNSKGLECLSCRNQYTVEDFSLEEKTVPKCPDCGRVLKPTVIFFGEAIPHRALTRSQILAETADAVLVVGTSAVVYPAASIPMVAKQKGAKVIQFDLEESEFSRIVADIFIQGKAGEMLPELLQCLTV
jgi:NAD-dependent deacetylase